jgi:hypothetical protein
MMCHTLSVYAYTRASALGWRALDYPVMSPHNPPQFFQSR